MNKIRLFAAYNYISAQQKKITSFLFRQRYALLVILSILFFSSTLFQMSVDYFIYTDKRLFAYVDQEVVDAANWLKSIDKDKIIFNSAENVINILPAYSGRKVYVGHGVETPFFRQKQIEVDWFFSVNRDEGIEKDFLGKRGIDYIFYGDSERRLGDYDPSSKAYLEEVYSNDLVQIYQIL